MTSDQKPIVIAHESGADFLAVAEPYLGLDEVRNAMPLGLCQTARATPSLELACLLTAVEGGVVTGLTLKSPGYPVILRATDDRAIHALAHALFDRRAEPGGVFGTADQAALFADVWARLSGQKLGVRMSQRLFKADRVRMPAANGGKLSVARASDFELVADWITAFVREALPGHPQSAEQLNASAEAKIKSGSTYLWVHDDRPVALAAVTGATPRGIRINTVYTPPKERGRGFASNVVAHVTQKMLDEGRRFCTLFTDLTNPASNKAYTNVGFEPVCNWTEYAFGRD